MEATIQIKPISVNQCWQGRRFKAPAYKAWETEMLLKMPKGEILAPPFRLYIEFGFSTYTSDLDNGLKPTIDLIQKKYGINDRDIMEIYAKKKIVKKGQEFIKYQITYI